jgi:hypothetical protein
MFARHGRNKPALVRRLRGVEPASQEPSQTSGRKKTNQCARQEPSPTTPRHVEVLGLRRESQCNDRQVLSIAMIAHIKTNGSAAVTGHRCERSCAWRTARPFRAWLESRTFTGRRHLVIDLMRRLAIQRRVRSILIEPVDIGVIARLLR